LQIIELAQTLKSRSLECERLKVEAEESRRARDMVSMQRDLLQRKVGILMAAQLSSRDRVLSALDKEDAGILRERLLLNGI
jgi:hypothetical protein